MKGFPWLSTLRKNFRDVVLMGFGGWVIWKQVYAQTPNATLAIIGLACMIPSGRAAVISILSEPVSPSRTSSSTSEQSAASSPSSSSKAGSGEKPKS